MDVLRVLAVSRSSGALEIRGTRSGVFFLQDGRVTYAEALGIPLEKKFGTDDPRLRVSLEKSIVDAGLILLTGAYDDAERPLFRPGRRHWSGNTCLVDVDLLLVEMEQQIAHFAELGVAPDDVVRLCPLPAGRTVTFNREQWALAAEMSDPQSARSLAWRLGVPLTVTVVNVVALVAAGVMERGNPTDRASRPPPIPHPSVPGSPFPGAATPGPAAPEPASRQSQREPPESAAAGTPDSRLPHRVPGSTPLPDPRLRRPPPAPDEERDDGRALALRLLEGLRRL